MEVFSYLVKYLVFSKIFFDPNSCVVSEILYQPSSSPQILQRLPTIDFLSLRVIIGIDAVQFTRVGKKFAVIILNSGIIFYLASRSDLYMYIWRFPLVLRIAERRRGLRICSFCKFQLEERDPEDEKKNRTSEEMEAEARELRHLFFAPKNC